MANLIKRILRLTDRQEAERATWQYRAIEATRGSQTRIGAVLLAVIGQQRRTRPRFGDRAVILKTGEVCASMIDRYGGEHPAVPVCTVTELQEGFSHLADELKLSDADRISMFATVRGWVAVDQRADSNLHFTKSR